MRTRHALTLAGAFAAAAAITPAIARAQTTTTTTTATPPDDPNDALVREGVELRRQGRDADALEVFRRAWEQHHTPRARAQMGLAQQALGDWLAADQSLREALAVTTDPWIAHNQVALQQALTAVGRQIGGLEIAGGVPGAEVFINGQRAGVLPLREPLHMLAATVSLEVRAPGYYPYVRDVAVLPAVPTREIVRLSPRAAGAPDVATTTTDARIATVPNRQGPRVALGIAGIGTGVVLLAGGVIANVVRENAAAHWNNDTDCLAPGGGTRGEQCGSYQSTANTAGALAIAGYAAGGAFAVTGVVLLLVGHGHAEAPDRASRVACGSGPGTLGASCTVRF